MCMSLASSRRRGAFRAARMEQRDTHSPISPEDPPMFDLDGLIAEVLPEATAVRHDLHAHPQLGYEETYASEMVQEYLTDAGVPFESGLAETGVVGWVTPDHAGADDPAIGLRADMDALPI